MVKCELCNKIYKSLQPLSKHISSFHNMDKKEYYDIFLKTNTDNICKKCGKPTHFRALDKGYALYCSHFCQVSDQCNAGNPVVRQKMRQTMMERYGYAEAFSNPETIKKSHSKECNQKRSLARSISTNNKSNKSNKNNKVIKNPDNKYNKYNKGNRTNKNSSFKNTVVQLKGKQTRLLKYGSNTYNNRAKWKQTIEQLNAQFEKDHNCTQVKTLIAKYGQGWRSLNLPTICKDHNAHFISNDYLPIIEQYSSSYHASNKEKYIYDEISKIYKGKILHNTKRIISPNELDIYIPELKLAIEFNGLFWHSTKHIIDKDYHLNKSIACRNLNIRLIHIYEFEDIEEQVNKIINLIKGIDLFNKNDFNKNNLESAIPNSEIIYNDTLYTVYGAGPLRTN